MSSIIYLETIVLHQLFVHNSDPYRVALLLKFGSVYIPMFRNATIMIQGCSEDPEQTASSKQSDQCLHCLQFILYFNEASLFSMPIFE